MRIYWITPWHQPPLRLTGGITACGRAPGHARGGSLCNLPAHPTRTPPQRLAVAAGSPSRRVAFSAVGDNCPLCQALDGKVFEAACWVRYTPMRCWSCTSCMADLPLELYDDPHGAVYLLSPFPGLGPR